MSCGCTSMSSSFAENGTVDVFFLSFGGFNAMIEQADSEILHSHFISHFFLEDCNGCV